MKNGVLPLLGITPRTPVSHIKKTLETMSGIPMSQQLLSSVGRVMHDEFFVEDFEGLHAIYEDSVLDLCKSGECLDSAEIHVCFCDLELPDLDS